MATEADWPHLWLSEGFATYLSWMYIEDAFGKDSMTALLVKGRKKVTDFYAKKQSPIVDSSVTNYLKLLNPNTYDKSGWVMHMIRRQTGDSLFWTALRKYYQAFAGKNAVTDDFRKILDTVTHKNWAPFFDQWLYGAGHPILSKSVTYDKARKSAVITIRQAQPKLFAFNLGILITGEGVSRKSVRVTERDTRVLIPMSEAPHDVRLDPQCDLLFEEK
jgi:aminopeptidase N